MYTPYIKQLNKRISPSWKPLCTVAFISSNSDLGDFAFLHSHTSLVPTYREHQNQVLPLVTISCNVAKIGQPTGMSIKIKCYRWLPSVVMYTGVAKIGQGLHGSYIKLVGGGSKARINSLTNVRHTLTISLEQLYH